MDYGVRWLLDCQPRPAQIEALARSYTGYQWRNHKNQEAIRPRVLPHAGKPAIGWGHFMEMRVGKTPTWLNEFMLFKADYGVSKGFMLSPNRYKETWGTEAAFFGVDVPVHVFHSKKRADFVQFMRKTKGEGLVIANYEALLYEDNTILFEEWVDDKTFIGGDESVMMKNYQGNFFEQGLKLSKMAAAARPLTGLPTPQGPSDIWSQLRFGRQLNGFNYHGFKHTYSEMGGFKNKKVLGVKNESNLNKLLEDCCFRARRRDWGTKIDSDYEEVSLEMLPKQKKAYTEMEKEFIAWIDDTNFVSADQVITKRMKMQQISSGFVIDGEGAVHQLVPFNKTPKFKDLLDRLTNEVAGKVLILAHYNATIMNLVEHLQQFNPALICGDRHMKRLDRNAEEEKARFNSDPSCKIMIGQSQAIKYGHTLMGSQEMPCLSIAYFENNYSLDNRAQTEERPQGEGQQDAIHIWDYFSSPIEREIVGALQKKKDIADTIMNYYNK